MFFHSCFFFLLNIYKGSQAEKVPQIQSQLKIALLFLARQSGINQGHQKEAREGRGADNLFIQFFFFQSSLSVINKLARWTAWDATQMFGRSCCGRSSLPHGVSNKVCPGREGALNELIARELQLLGKGRDGQNFPNGLGNYMSSPDSHHFCSLGLGLPFSCISEAVID